MSLKTIAHKLFLSTRTCLSVPTGLPTYQRQQLFIPIPSCTTIIYRSLSSSSETVPPVKSKGKRVRVSSRMASLPEEVKAKLDQIPDARIEDTGRFKYILIKVFVKDKDGKDLDSNSKLVVRGRSDCPYHADIFDKFQEEIAHLEGVDDDVLGGGRIERTSNKIFVFGYSQGYGKADHTLTVQVLKKHFPGHDITWSDDGY